MKIISVGGFFHDLNYSYIDTENIHSLISLEEERFSRIKSHKIKDENVLTEFLGLKYIEFASGCSLMDVNYLIISDNIVPDCISAIKNLVPNAELISVGHHLSHAYNVLASNKSHSESGTALVFDGYGDHLSGIAGSFDNGNVNIRKEYSSESSLGLLYSSATQHLGLGGFGSEGKMQGLASYGNYQSKYSIAEELSTSQGEIFVSQKLLEKDSFADQELYAIQALNKNLFYNKLISKRFYDEDLTQAHADFARTIQDDIFQVIKDISIYFKSPNSDLLLLSGGIAQNSSLINFLYKNTPYQRIVSSTSCSDRGNSLGALAAYLQSIGISLNLDSPFVGFNSCSQSSSLCDSDLEAICSLLMKDKVIGLVQGKAELGARALGNRSIIASPKSKVMQDHLNTKVKHRESFRPFAPVLFQKDINKYYDHAGASDHKYMTKCFQSINNTSELYPSAVHIDGTSRLQILDDQDNNRDIYRILDNCASSFDCDILLNTSFNDNGMPIVNSRSEAIACARKCNLDALIVDSEIVEF